MFKHFKPHYAVDMSDEDEETCYFMNKLTCESCEGTTFMREDGEEDNDGFEGVEKLRSIYSCTSAAMCADCGEVIEPEDFPWVRMYENYCCGLVLASEKLSDKLKKCKVDVGEGEEKAITVVTNDSKVREGDRLIVARIGARVPASSTEEEGTIVVKKTSVAGTSSEGMLCDAPMLQWGNGSKGVAYRVPDSIDLGSCPPRIAPDN